MLGSVELHREKAGRMCICCTYRLQMRNKNKAQHKNERERGVWSKKRYSLLFVFRSFRSVSFAQFRKIKCSLFHHSYDTIFTSIRVCIYVFRRTDTEPKG